MPNTHGYRFWQTCMHPWVSSGIARVLNSTRAKIQNAYHTRHSTRGFAPDWTDTCSHEYAFYQYPPNTGSTCTDLDDTKVSDFRHMSQFTYWNKQFMNICDFNTCREADTFFIGQKGTYPNQTFHELFVPVCKLRYVSKIRYFCIVQNGTCRNARYKKYRAKRYVSSESILLVSCRTIYMIL